MFYDHDPKSDSALMEALERKEPTIKHAPNFIETTDDALAGISRLMRKYHRSAGGRISVTDDLAAAANGVDVLYTDVWISMGKEAESAERLKSLTPYQLNKSVVQRANPNVLVMHCLPAYREKEITTEVLEQHAETIFTQAENRLHVQKGVLAWLVGRTEI